MAQLDPAQRNPRARRNPRAAKILASALANRYAPCHPARARRSLGDCLNPSVAQKDLPWERASVVLARHRKAVRARIENDDSAWRRNGQGVRTKVVRALAH